jgi:hypothetical protein
MDWFEALFGFAETSPESVQRQLLLEGDVLVSRANGMRFGVGRLSVPSLTSLREACAKAGLTNGPASNPSGASCSEFRLASGDVRELHRQAEFDGAIFQVASQFNLLEMISPSVRPEDGVTRYAGDPTQGPACALAAAAATVYRNYFVAVDGNPDAPRGQTASRQVDTSARLREALATRLGEPASALWAMRNGYALPTEASLHRMAQLIEVLDVADREELKGLVEVGVHTDVEVTDAGCGQRVTQIYCSAMPVAYGVSRGAPWEPLARLVLEAAYEATFRVAALQRVYGVERPLLVTRLGGGAFGNDLAWIDDAIERAWIVGITWGLDVRLVVRGAIGAADKALRLRLTG